MLFARDALPSVDEHLSPALRADVLGVMYSIASTQTIRACVERHCAMMKVYHRDLNAWRSATATTTDGAAQDPPRVTRARRRAITLGFDELPDMVPWEVSRPRKRKKRSRKTKTKDAGKSAKRANIHRDSDYSDVSE